jgi:Na+-transporting NADH:ubiquinone oxidoreductase subunit C
LRVSSNDSIKKTLTVAFLLCVVCSVIVSTAAVVLKPSQEANQALDRKRNILAAAGMLDENRSVDELFAQVDTRVVDLRTGRFTDAVEAADYDQRRAAKDSALSDALGAGEDPAKILRKEHYALVYLFQDSAGGIDRIVLPVHGYGLWGQLYGFIALENDAQTVAGLGFYEHKETPGLGGEVDNPRWKALWPGKQAYRDGEVAIEVIKGTVIPGSPNSDYKVDGLAGATLTTRGISNLVQYWLGDSGFAPFLANLKAGEA